MFYYCLSWIIQFEEDTCLLNISSVQNTDFGSWTCHGNDFDTWLGGKVGAVIAFWQIANIIINLIQVSLHELETAIEIEILDKRGGVLFGTVQVESGNKKSQNSIPVAQDYDLIYKTVYTWLYLVILY